MEGIEETAMKMREKNIPERQKKTYHRKKWRNENFKG